MIKCGECGTEVIPDMMNNCPECGAYMDEDVSEWLQMTKKNFKSPSDFGLTAGNVTQEWNGKLMDYINASLKTWGIPVEDHFCEYVNCNWVKDKVAELIRMDVTITRFSSEDKFIFVYGPDGKELRC